MKQRADIQGLRAVAVLLVVLADAGVPGITGGYVGVDVFFVVSGFLITSILLHEATEHGTVSLAGFYGKRARRILPAATFDREEAYTECSQWREYARFLADELAERLELPAAGKG